MSDTSLSISGFDQILAAFDEMALQAQSDIGARFAQAAQNTLQTAQANAPVGETGDLQASGHIESIDAVSIAVVFGDGESTSTQYTYGGGLVADGYAWFVELSTTKMAAQPFLGPAFDEENQSLMDDLNGLLP
jgi:HK97 gp10 family phage protein